MRLKFAKALGELWKWNVPSTINVAQRSSEFFAFSNVENYNVIFVCATAEKLGEFCRANVIDFGSGFLTFGATDFAGCTPEKRGMLVDVGHRLLARVVGWLRLHRPSIRRNRGRSCRAT